LFIALIVRRLRVIWGSRGFFVMAQNKNKSPVSRSMALFVCAVKVYPERGALGLWDFFTGNLAKLHPLKVKKNS